LIFVLTVDLALIGYSGADFKREVNAGLKVAQA
jgi:hypothetical protein